MIDLDMAIHGGTAKDAIVRLTGGESQQSSPKPARKPLPEVVVVEPPAEPQGDYKLTATYKYRDAMGKLRYEIERHESTAVPTSGTKRKKTFRQFHFDATGKRVAGMDGVERLLYRLPEISGKKEVLIVEGEKCVDAAVKIGWDATCNSGGSNGWLPALAESLTGKDVTICPDNDPAGEKWLASILPTLEGKANLVRVVKLPTEWNDIADVVEAKGEQGAAHILTAAYVNGRTLPRGYDVPCETVDEAYRAYATNIQHRRKVGGVSLATWLPSMSRYTRHFFTGDMIVFLADTGVGKTGAVLNMSMHIKRPSVIFQLELTNEQLAERYAAMVHHMDRRAVEDIAADNGPMSFEAVKHTVLCKKRNVRIEDIAEGITRSALLFGAPVECAYVDYIGLVKGQGSKRYERMSSVAEDLKTLACELKVVLFCTSQMHRPEEDNAGVPKLHSAKDSSSIESSAQLMLGAWRGDEGSSDMYIKLLKNTNGPVGAVIECVFDGNSGVIKEKEFRL